MSQIRTTTQIHAAKGSFGGYQLIFAASLLVFFAIALAGQVFGMDWRSWLPGAEGAKTLHGGVKAAVYTFMSHIQ